MSAQVRAMTLTIWGARRRLSFRSACRAQAPRVVMAVPGLDPGISPGHPRLEHDGSERARTAPAHAHHEWEGLSGAKARTAGLIRGPSPGSAMTGTSSTTTAKVTRPSKNFLTMFLYCSIRRLVPLPRGALARRREVERHR